MTSTFNEDVGIELLYRSKELVNVPFAKEVVEKYNSFAQELGLAEIVSSVEYSKDFNIPQHYKDIDVEEYIISLIPESKGVGSNPATARVEMELAQYKARNLFPVLQLLIYIIDTLRMNDVVWGVGRGSSVASYVLYLLGVHKVDSLKYNLDIREFLK
jgi:DNA polymerase III alpha subunit